MVQKSDNPADPFKKALAEATKVMSHDPDLTVSYSVDPAGLSGEAMRLPQVSRRMSRDEVLQARGTADALAMSPDDAKHHKLLQKPFGMDILSRTIRQMLKSP
jgi:cobaltochelatase CobT